MSKIIVFTLAYNAEKTLCRAVDSILKQTYGDFLYYLVDNGSKDGTRQLIKQYAENDNRILPFFYDDNYVYRSFDFFQRIIADQKGDYMAVLDSDDEYKLDYLENITNFISKNGLEFAAGGNEFIDAASGRQLGTRGFNQNILISGDGFAHIELYYATIRTVWCKIFSIKTLKKINFKPFYNIRYGADTAFCLSVLEQCNNFGILAGTHYKYYMNPKSDSYTYDPKRIKADQILLDVGEQFLAVKCGAVNPQSVDFLYVVYMNAIRDTLNVLLNAKVSPNEKLDGLREIFTCEHTKQLAARDNLGAYLGQSAAIQKLRRELFADVAAWMLALNEVPDEQVEGFCDVGEFVCAAAEYADGWIFFQKLRVSFLIDQGRTDAARVKLDELEKLLPNDKEVLEFRKKLNK